jgi:hypothetical protein
MSYIEWYGIQSFSPFNDVSPDSKQSNMIGANSYLIGASSYMIGATCGAGIDHTSGTPDPHSLFVRFMLLNL